MNNEQLIDKLNREKSLQKGEWISLISSCSADDFEYAKNLAQKIAVENFGKTIYFRGIIEYTNYCKNDCLYCGIRRSNKGLSRYRLLLDEIMECCADGYRGGFRTFVLQGGEDLYFNDDRMVEIIKAIKQKFPDCAVTLSIGEKEKESYERFFKAGADRYLLRHETADNEHYKKLHPKEMSLEHRLNCLKELKNIGFQTGCGFMVGTPFQTPESLADDMMYITEFQPQMVGIGPFISHKDTPFRDKQSGDAAKTLFLLSLTRILLPNVLLPATTALGTARGDGRQLGVLCGCNVIMPNLSPMSVRKKYMLYDNKAGTSDTAQTGIEKLRAQMDEIGYSVTVGRGDFKEKNYD